MLALRRRCRPKIESALGQRVVFAGIPNEPTHASATCCSEWRSAMFLLLQTLQKSVLKCWRWRHRWDKLWTLSAWLSRTVTARAIWHMKSAASWPCGESALAHRNFHPLEVVSRYRDPQLEVAENHAQCSLNIDILSSCTFSVQNANIIMRKEWKPLWWWQ